MEFLHAINALERKVQNLGMKMKDGTPIPPVVGMGKIGRFHGIRYDFCISSLRMGNTTVEEYFLEMNKMITEYQNRERPLDELHHN